MIDRRHVCTLPRVPADTRAPPTAGTFATKLRQLRELFLPCAWHACAERYLRSDKRLRSERERTKGAVCHPYSAAAFGWQCLHGAITLALLLYVPFQVFVDCPNRSDRFILFADFMSLVNIALSTVTGYVDRDSKQVVLRRKLVVEHYLRTAFPFDLVGALPLQLVAPIEDCRCPANTAVLALKLCRLVTFRKEWKGALRQLRLSYVARRLASLGLKAALFFHWMTYVHRQVPCAAVRLLSAEPDAARTVRELYRRQTRRESPLGRYTENLFRTSGICIGAGYSSADEGRYPIGDLALTSFVGVAGLLFLAHALAVVLQLAIRGRRDADAFAGRLGQLSEYAARRRLPERLRRNVRLFLAREFGGRYFDEGAIAGAIDERLRRDIDVYGARGLVAGVPVLRDLPAALVDAIVFRLTRVSYVPGQRLVKCGEPGRSLFLISSGTVAVVNSAGREMMHLRDGAYFGMTALLFPGTERSTTIVALEVTEVYRLDDESLQTCLQPYPHLLRRIEEGFLKLRRRV